MMREKYTHKVEKDIGKPFNWSNKEEDQVVANNKQNKVFFTPVPSWFSDRAMSIYVIFPKSIVNLSNTFKRYVHIKFYYGLN